jgi:hypothetical protein
MGRWNRLRELSIVSERWARPRIRVAARAGNNEVRTARNPPGVAVYSVFVAFPGSVGLELGRDRWGNGGDFAHQAP